MPTKLRDLTKALKKFDVTKGQGGNHPFFARPGVPGRYPIPNGKELDDCYVDAAADALKIGRKELWKVIRGGKN